MHRLKYVVMKAVFYAFTLIGASMVSFITVNAETGSDNNMTVTASFADKEMTMTITGIDAEKKDQLLAYSLMEAGTDEIIYANEIYINGQEDLKIAFPVDRSSLEGCVLNVNNKDGLQRVVIEFKKEGKEKEVPPNTDGKQETTSRPITGDTAAVWPAVVLLLAGAGLVILFAFRRKKGDGAL